MNPTLLLFFLFWSFGPALLAMWLFREGGRSRFAGFLAGFFFGLLGVLTALLVVKLTGPAPPAHGKPTGGRPVRIFYSVPVVGRLHVSTVWALAGVATFVCAWGSGGIGYELYRAFERGEVIEWREGVLETKSVSRPAEASGNVADQISEQEGPRLQNGASQTQPQPGSLLNGLVSAPRQGRPDPVSDGAAIMSEAVQQSSSPRQPTAGSQAAAPSVRQEMQAEPPRPASAATPDPHSPTTHPSAPPGRAVAAEAARLLATEGHRVHASLSGDGSATTLTVTGATLTRATGGRLLGNGRVREALKSSGVRVVVLVNGAESWTFIL